MIDRAFLKAGYAPALRADFFHFDVSFIVCAILGPPGVAIGNGPARF